MAQAWNWVTQDQTMGNPFSNSVNVYNSDRSEQFDSTWEDEPEDTTEGQVPEQSVWGPRRNTRAAEDMQCYRHFYQLTQIDEGEDDDLEDDGDSPNVRFYRNKIHFYPDGVFIEEFHKDWFGNYGKLEYVHSYIQWLFPIQEKGMNYESQELSLKEIKMFRKDEEVKRRLLESYKLMLNFYGIELVREETGEVKRAKNWRARFENLNRNTHNNLRITRIIKSLGLLGFRHYQKPLVHFFLEETLVEETLPRVKRSVLDYFMFAVLDKVERKELIKFAFINFKPRDEFVWCPWRICAKFLKEEKTVSPKTETGSSEGVSSDSSSPRDQKEDETKIHTNEDTSNEKSLSNESSNDENVLGKCQDSEKQASPVTPAENDTNERTEAPSGVDPEPNSHIDSNKDAAPKDDDQTRNKHVPKSKEKSDENGNEDPNQVLSGDKNFHNSAASDESTNEHLTQTSNHGSKSENVANETPLSGANSGSEQKNQENQGHDSIQDNTDECKSQHTDGDPKEEDSEESQKTDSKSPKDSMKTETENNNEANSVHCDAEMLNQVKSTGAKERVNESKEDPAHQSKEDHLEDGHQSHSTENSDSTDDKNCTESGQSTALRSDNSSQDNPGDDTEGGMGSPEEKKTETGVVGDEGTEKDTVEGKKIDIPGSDRNGVKEKQESDQGKESLKEPKASATSITSPPNKDAQSECGPTPCCAPKDIEQTQQPVTTLINAPESDKAGEPQNQGDETLNQLKATGAKDQVNEKKEDPAHQSKEDDLEDGLQSHNNENSDSTDDKNYTESGQSTALRSGNSSQDNPGDDTEGGMGSHEEKKTETGIVGDEGTEKDTVEGKNIDIPGSDRNGVKEKQESDQGKESLKEPKASATLITSPPNKDAQSECGPTPHSAPKDIEQTQQPLTTLINAPESDKAGEPQNQGDEMLNQLKATGAKDQVNEKKEDPAHQSKEDDLEDGLQSHSNEDSDSTDVKNCTESGQSTAGNRHGGPRAYPRNS